MLKYTPDARGGWEGGGGGELRSLGGMQGFARDQLRISTRPPWKRSAAVRGDK